MNGLWSKFSLQNWMMANNKSHHKIKFGFVNSFDFDHFISILFWDKGWSNEIQSKIEKFFWAILKFLLKHFLITSYKYLVQTPNLFDFFFIKGIRWKQAFFKKRNTLIQGMSESGRNTIDLNRSRDPRCINKWKVKYFCDLFLTLNFRLMWNRPKKQRTEKRTSRPSCYHGNRRRQIKDLLMEKFSFVRW